MKVNLIDMVSAYAFEINKHKSIEVAVKIRDKVIDNLGDLFHVLQASPEIDLNRLVFTIDDTVKELYKYALKGGK